MLEKNFKTILLVEIFIFIIVISFYVYQYSKNTFPQRTFSVTGEGKEVAIPNIAEIKIGLISEGKDLINIQKENIEKFNKVISFLKSKGVDEKDIKTENYSITPKYKYDKVSEIVGYTVNQSLSVKIRDLNKIGEILNGVIKNGANNVYGPNFTVDDKKVYIERAREKAIKDAKEQAEKIAKMVGFRLGKIISISEANYPMPIYQGGGEMSGIMPKGISPQIQPGSQEIGVSITIVYEIK